MIRHAGQLFRSIFDAAPTAFGISPGRAEVLGNHTDYNLGAVLTAAIDRHVVVAGRAISDSKARVHSEHFGATSEFEVDSPADAGRRGWVDYVAGVVRVLRSAGERTPGFEAVVVGDLPVGAGLSSSAAIEAATAMFVLALRGQSIPANDLAPLLRNAEHCYIGVQCGILDQFSVLRGREDHLIALDTHELSVRYLELPRQAVLVLCGSGTARELSGSLYNQRREECAAALAMVGDRFGVQIEGLCRIDAGLTPEIERTLPEQLVRRARHVVSEQARVLSAADRLAAGDLAGVGALMNESQRSSQLDFENSSPALDLLCEIAVAKEGCYGARLSGGGWGGATVNLVEREAAGEFAEAVSAEYSARSGRRAEILICRPAGGAVGGRY